MNVRRLLREPAHQIAPRLLGAQLRSYSDHGDVVARIVEVEAYGGADEDPGSHAFRGQTPRNNTMFGDAGHAYVYFTYGMHWCVNVTTGPAGVAGAVLIRAAHIVSGLEIARSRRPGSSDRDLARGPARLAKALAIDGRLDGIDLLAPKSPLRLALAGPAESWSTSPRTGVGGAGAWIPWRFYLPDEPTVSAYRAHQSKSRNMSKSRNKGVSRLARE